MPASKAGDRVSEEKHNIPLLPQHYEGPHDTVFRTHTNVSLHTVRRTALISNFTRAHVTIDISLIARELENVRKMESKDAPQRGKNGGK